MIEAILNGITPDSFLGFLFWSVIGGIIGILTQQIKFAKPIKANGGFSIVVWLKENWVRSVTAILIMIVGIIFQKELTGVESTNFTSLMAGFTIDTVVDRFVNRKK
jgi:hypothetical protein